MALEKDDRDDGIDLDALLGVDDKKREARIRCPRCGYRPRKTDRWSCTCEFVWNTFDTGGQCPRCQRQWESTGCPACRTWSRHKDWYGAE